MIIRYYGSDGLIHTLGDRSVLMHFNQNHDRLGRFARKKWGSGDPYDDSERYLGDYTVSPGDVYRRREDSGSKETNDLEDRGYTYVYDPKNARDDEFYTQFGKRIVDKQKCQ